jgi:lysophospholipase L1-like esterase
MKILALGDCNTRGIEEYYNNAYPEMLAKELNAEVKNLGHTMATTREAVELFNEVKDEHFDIVLISFGLTDSWKTFKHAPYVLYYPDSIFRKILRKIVKKFKKIGKKLRLSEIFGEESVVPEKEYIANLQYILSHLNKSKIFILDTLPKREEYRNVSIKEYNLLLDSFTASKNVTRIKLYDYFDEHRELFLDKTHLNKEGYEYISRKIIDTLDKHDTNREDGVH